MATIRTTYKYACDLDKGTYEVNLRSPLMQADSQADAFRVSVTRNGADVDVSGMNAYGYMYIAANQTTVALGGTVSGNTAEVVLTSDCYAVPGYASLVIQLHEGDVRHTVLKVNMYIERTGGNRVLTGGDVLPTLAELLTKISAMEQATTEANEAADTANEAAASVEAFKGEIEDDIAALTEEIRDFTTFTLLNRVSEHLTEKIGIRTTASGYSDNGNYNSYVFEAKRNCYLYFEETTASIFQIWLFSGEPSSETYVYDYSLANGNLPSKENPLSVKKGTTVSFCFSSGSEITFSAYCDGVGEILLSEKLVLNKAQLKQVDDNHGFSELNTVIPVWEEDFYYSATNGQKVHYTPTASAKFWASDLIPCHNMKSVKFLATFNGTDVGYVFFDENKNIVHPGRNEGSRFVELIVDVPDRAYYFATTSRADSNMVNRTEIVYLFTDYVSLARTTLDEKPLDRMVYDGGYMALFKTFGVIGDSLASGCCYEVIDGEIVGGGDMMDYSWGQLLARMMGSTCHNFTKGGYTTRSWLNDYNGNEQFESTPCQAYIIGLGVNDRATATKVDIGTSADIDFENRENNADTYYGNYASIIQYIQSIVPKAKIFVITNPRAEDEYNVAVRYMATVFDNVYLVDLYTYGKYLYTNASLGDMWVSSHLSAVGYKKSAYEISSYIDFIIRNNVVDFNNIPFILE